MKPFTTNQVLFGVKNALSRRKLEIENNAQRETLEEIVRARTMALERSAKRLKLSREETVRRLSRAVEYRDEETGGHTERMSAYSAMLAGKLGVDVESIRIASPMHDVGKVALPDHILLRPGALTPDERREMERHTLIGFQILSGSGSALLELGATIALTHHEKWDGSGYPHQLVGNAIPLDGQVAAVADVFDALTSDRPYRQAFPIEQAVEILRGERGRHFDPRLVDLFIENVDELNELRVRYTPSAEAVTRPPAPHRRRPAAASLLELEPDLRAVVELDAPAVRQAVDHHQAPSRALAAGRELGCHEAGPAVGDRHPHHFLGRPHVEGDLTR